MQISAAKFTPKVITKHLIEQTELVQHLTAKPLRNVAIVQGLAGYGKTTLLLQYLAWLQAKKARTIWINLEKADNDISADHGTDVALSNCLTMSCSSR